METAQQFLDAIAQVESSDDPHAWGDDDRAVGTYQVHVDRLFDEARRYRLTPMLGERFNAFVARVLSAIYFANIEVFSALEIAMYWHLGHWAKPGIKGWDLEYERKFNDAFSRALGQAIT